VRFARDLHDLLGYGLSAVTLESELILRLIGTNDERARAEMPSRTSCGTAGPPAPDRSLA
jgi:two-component system sensor histidine kinase DesK